MYEIIESVLGKSPAVNSIVGQTDSKFLELVLAPESSGSLGSDSSPEVLDL